MTIHTFEVFSNVSKEHYYLIQNKLKKADPTKWAKEKSGMTYWGLSGQGIIIRMFITRNRKKNYYSYNITYRISARRVMDNHDFVGLFDTKKYKELEKEVDILLYCKCEFLPPLKDCKMKRIDFCFNAKFKNQEQVKAYIKTMKRANIPDHLNLLESYDKKSKRTKPMKDDFTVYINHYVAISIYNKQRQMIKEQKEKKKTIFPASEIDRAENIVRIEIRCMEDKVSALKKKFQLKSVEDFMISAHQIGDDLFKYYLSKICNNGKIYTLSEALKRLDMGSYRPEKTSVLKRFIEYSNQYRSAAKALTLYREVYNNKKVSYIIWLLSNIDMSYVTATTNVAKLFNKGYIPTPLELYEEWCGK